MGDSGRGSILVENLVALLVISVALLILYGGLMNGSGMYRRIRSRYLAELTAENVYNLVLAGESVPKRMNGFDVSYSVADGVLRVRVGRYEFAYAYDGGRR